MLEEGVNTGSAVRVLNEADNAMPSAVEMNTYFASPTQGNFALADEEGLVNQVPRSSDVAYDFCGYPRGETADLGAIEYTTSVAETPCAEHVQRLYDRIP